MFDLQHASLYKVVPDVEEKNVIGFETRVCIEDVEVVNSVLEGHVLKRVSVP